MSNLDNVKSKDLCLSEDFTKWERIFPHSQPRAHLPEYIVSDAEINQTRFE